MNSVRFRHESRFGLREISLGKLASIWRRSVSRYSFESNWKGELIHRKLRDEMWFLSLNSHSFCSQLPDLFPLCRAHTAPVLDTHWSPFDDSLVASVGEDGKLALTKIDDALLQDAWSGDRKDLPDLEPIWSTSAHGRKAGHVRFHPSASNVLATASTDVKIWDLESQKAVCTSETHSDMVQSIDWDWCGALYATTCKDKKLRLFDPRAGAEAVTVADSHSGVKGSRVTWCGDKDRMITTGFSRTSERQVFMWDSRDISKGPIKQMGIDQSSGMLMPFFNAGNKCAALVVVF